MPIIRYIYVHFKLKNARKTNKKQKRKTFFYQIRGRGAQHLLEVGLYTGLYGTCIFYESYSSHTSPVNFAIEG